MFTKQQLTAQLAQMGLLSNDIVLIHTSYKAIGTVEGGIDALLDAFCEYLSDGLFLVPTHTWANVSAADPVYDVNRTEPCIGAVPCVAAFRKDGVRSLHPTHSVWAHGKGAAEFIRGEENADSPAPVGFLWDRLADCNAKILLIGVLHNRNTFIHSVDERAQLADRLSPEPWPVTIIDAEGNRLQRSMRNHRCSRTDDVSQFYVNFDKPLTETGAQIFGKLGNADVRVVDAAACRELVLRVYSRAKEDLFTEFREFPPELYR